MSIISLSLFYIPFLLLSKWRVREHKEEERFVYRLTLVLDLKMYPCTVVAPFFCTRVWRRCGVSFVFLLRQTKRECGLSKRWWKGKKNYFWGPPPPLQQRSNKKKKIQIVLYFLGSSKENLKKKENIFLKKRKKRNTKTNRKNNYFFFIFFVAM